MRQPRIYTDHPLEPGREVRLDSASSRYLLKVLRLRPGASLLLFNGDEREFQGRVEAIAENRVNARIETLNRCETATRLQLNLLIGVSKGERMDFAIRKAVELGVTGITPLFTSRSVVRLQGERLQRRISHWQGVVVSACEQCGRCRLPKLHAPDSLQDAVQSAASDLRLVLHHRGESGLDQLKPPEECIDLLVGPEGGLEAEEIVQARQQGFVPLRLGPRIMRTETAPLAALAAIQTLWGDFRGK